MSDKYKNIKICRGSWVLGNNCRRCQRCIDTCPSASKAERDDARAPKGKLRELHFSIEHAINYNSMEQYTNTPDWVLADYLISCYKAFEKLNSDKLDNKGE